MTLAFSLYSLIFFSILIWAYYDSKFKNNTLSAGFLSSFFKFYPVLIFTIIIGFRYNVGGDFPTYVNYYNEQYDISDPSKVPYEFGFFLIISTLQSLGLDYQSIFIVVAAVQIILLLKIIQLSNESRFLVLFFYFTTLSFLESLNVMRQGVAVLAVVLAVYYFKNKNYLNFILNSVIAMCFHNSSLFAIPIIILISNLNFIKYRIFIILLIFIFNVFSIEIFKFLISIITELGVFGKYSGYLEVSSDLFIKSKNNSISIGLIISTFTDIYIITSYQRVKKNSNYRGLSCYFINAFIVGTLMYPLAAASGFITLQRIMMYFYGVKYLVISDILMKGMNNGNWIERKGFMLFIILTFYLVWFIAAVSIGAAGSSPFKFNSSYF
ncbi:EpsG family protein [Shewanella fodinae]|uniref:EpsG-like putative glucosyltransferase n=1 Tax=Shewanella fodinae TaxID=552357 RepID=A0A4R2F5M6_9GAMM|nr:EpsG family protein [Shewanella fodinae]TCN77393.1 EpsG-like putative glucosyltransferase [Shewanella fodinae]